MLMAVRTGPSALKLQYMHPVAASSEYTSPPALPTNNRPPTTAGWENAIGSLGNAKAHFSLSLGTSPASRPCFFWKCELVGSEPQPDQSPSAILSEGAG